MRACTRLIMLERLYEKHAVPTSIAPVANKRSEHETGTMSPSARAHSQTARAGCRRPHLGLMRRACNGSSCKKFQEGVTLGKEIAHSGTEQGERS